MENNQLPNNNSSFTHFVGIRFPNGVRSYFFGVKNADFKVDDNVVVETARGIELGTVSVSPIEMQEYQNNLPLKPVLRKATETDMKIFLSNKKDAEYALKVCQEEVTACKLDMRLISCEYTLDKSKVIFSYLADERVDFRELLKALASRLHTRIELRQIGSRDKAKMIGGLGTCGLPLCCSTFLNEFDGVSINKAKNQMLAINIPKLSGHCGKLMCCLQYEDDAYTELKKLFPEIGKEVFIDKVQYTVGQINVISKSIRLDNEEGMINMSLEDFNKATGRKDPSIEHKEPREHNNTKPGHHFKPHLNKNKNNNKDEKN